VECHRIDYDALWSETKGLTDTEALDYFEEHLPFLCRDAYLLASDRPSDILRVQQEGFEYVFDNYTAIEARGDVPYSVTQESRLVVAHGRSAPRKRGRDDYRLRGWVGPTEKTFGAGWDKGHFIAHSLGGAVDGVEANVFVQRRDLNRGWSEDGKRFRRMEQFCVDNPGTLCFARPIYQDGTSRPAWIEFGVVEPASGPRVELFDNRQAEQTT